MCGIVGIIGKSDVASLLVDALKRLEYRGYDSAGVATIDRAQVTRLRASGKLVNLENKLQQSPLHGALGIGHTRWATHGAPTENNAHPHAYPVDRPKVAVVHNGIIENYKQLRVELDEGGYTTTTQTDTETVALLLAQKLDKGLSPQDAVKQVLPRLEGAFALGIIFATHDNLLIGARRGSPLALGYGEGEMYLGSDAIALSPFTSQITYLEEGDWAVLTRDGATVFDADNHQVTRAIKSLDVMASAADKGKYRHFMLKEINEQPEALSRAIAAYIDLTKDKVDLRQPLPFDFAQLERLTISACGTASYAGMMAKYWFERHARLPVDIDVASELRYREPPMAAKGLSLFISQSGETADTLAALRYCKNQNQHVASLVNVVESTIARESHMAFPIMAGPEIGVASTKALTNQLTVLAILALLAARDRAELAIGEEEAMVKALAGLPKLFAQAMAVEPQIEEIAKYLSKFTHALFLGRGHFLPVALEGALKLKEISYIHAEAYPAGELKHGPIALIDEHKPVIVVAPFDKLAEKTLSNMQEVAARDGQIILITDEEGAQLAGGVALHTIIMPKAHNFVAPILSILPVQLLSYHTAVVMGTDVDQPRNLAKSVTVE